MHMAIARDVARPAGAGPDRPQGLLHRRHHRRVLPHAEVIVRAPDRHLGADAVIIGARKPTAAPLEIGEHAVPPLGAQRTETLSEEALGIHAGPRWLPLLWLRVVIDYFASRRRGELADGSLHPIAFTILPRRGHLVVI